VDILPVCRGFANQGLLEKNVADEGVSMSKGNSH